MLCCSRVHLSLPEEGRPDTREQRKLSLRRFPYFLWPTNFENVDAMFVGILPRNLTRDFCSGLVHTSDKMGSAVGIGSTRSVTIQCKSKSRIGSEVRSMTKSESEGSEEFLFLLIPLPIWWEQREQNWKWKQNYQRIKKLITSPFQT